MKIALFGGRFDPPHNGHLKIAREVLRSSLGFDEVWLIPDNQHHWSPTVASPQQRLEMLRFLETPRIKVSDIAIRRGGKTFTLDIVTQLQETSSHKYTWICGVDLIKDFHKWGDYQLLQQKIPFLVFPRLGYDTPAVLPYNFSLLNSESYEAVDDSATRIRDRLRQ